MSSIFGVQFCSIKKKKNKKREFSANSLCEEVGEDEPRAVAAEAPCCVMMQMASQA